VVVTAVRVHQWAAVVCVLRDQAAIKRQVHFVSRNSSSKTIKIIKLFGNNYFTILYIGHFSGIVINTTKISTGNDVISNYFTKTDPP